MRAEKGINLPDTDLAATAVSDTDLPLLEVAAVHADMLAVSFLRHERDVDELHRYLKAVRAEHLGVILKIETTAAFTRLPDILLHAMRSPLVGVMIARGNSPSRPDMNVWRDARGDPLLVRSGTRPRDLGHGSPRSTRPHRPAVPGGSD